MTIQPISGRDLIVWPDGAQCHRAELQHMEFMGNEYEVVPENTERWLILTQEAACGSLQPS